MLFITIALCVVQSTMADSEKDRITLMRTEREASVALHISDKGELIHQDKAAACRSNYCMIDFTLGVKDPAPGTKECYEGPTQASFDAGTGNVTHTATNNATSEEEEYDREKCSTAAARAGAHQGQHFLLHQQREECHPRGCFVAKCGSVMNTSTSGAEADEWCYYYNPISQDPNPNLDADVRAICGYDANDPSTHNLQGQPVCERKRFLLGKSGTVKDCPDGYTTISNSTNAGKANEAETLGHDAELMCHSVVSCLALKDGSEVGGQFRADVLEASNYDKFPKGCFLDLQDAAYYNQERPEYASDGSSHPEPLGCCENPDTDQTEACGTVCATAANGVGRTERCWDSKSPESCGATGSSSSAPSYVKGRPICIVKDVVNWKRPSTKDTGLPSSFFSTTAAPSSM